MRRDSSKGKAGKKKKKAPKLVQLEAERMRGVDVGELARSNPSGR